MIEAHLNRITLTEEQRVDLRLRMQSTTQLARELRRRQSLAEVLILLYAELTGENRPSYVSRIHSRYRALCGARDTEALKLWAKRKQLSRST